MHPLIRHAARQKERIISDIRELVECESPSDSAADVNRCAELMVEQARDVATPKLIRSDCYGKHLRLDFKLPGRGKQGRLLGVGHSDTVWPLGTLSGMPWRRRQGRLWGPGVLDMKAGIVFFIHAARVLRELDMPVQRNVSLWIVSDEEVGSRHSRALTEAEAKASDCVLVMEPGSNMVGKLKTARKGIAGYRLVIEGKATHAGIDFSNGASAILEMARQIERIAGFTNLERGTTVNVGVIRGGTRTNVVAAQAHAEIDVRVRTARDAVTIDRKMRSLRPFDKRCHLTVEGGLNRPPMERSKAVAGLFKQAQQIGAEMGIELDETATGGGSDGNFTAALGIPTLDGLGAIGEGAHAVNESILIDRIAERTGLLAALLSRL